MLIVVRNFRRVLAHGKFHEQTLELVYVLDAVKVSEHRKESGFPKAVRTMKNVLIGIRQMQDDACLVEEGNALIATEFSEIIEILG